MTALGGWRSSLRGDPVPWLLEREDPAIHHLTLRELMDEPADAPSVRRARAAAMRLPPISSILDGQEPPGYWVKPGSGYGPKYTGTVWSLMFLDQMGADMTCDAAHVAARERADAGARGRRARSEGPARPRAPIAGNARKLLRLVTDLLDLDRLSQGLLEPQRAAVDLAEVVRNVVAESGAVTDRDVAVVATATTVAIDDPKVEQIVENLLVNAARHTPPDAHIWMRVQPGNGGAILTVEDDGPGLFPEDRDRVFGAFERGVNAATHAPGSGIGLTLVARFAELHGGRAWAEEREGGGASFLVWLPSGGAAPRRRHCSHLARRS